MKANNGTVVQWYSGTVFSCSIVILFVEVQCVQWSELFRVVQSCLELLRVVQKMFKVFQKMFKVVQKMFKVVQSCSEDVQSCSFV